MNTDIDENENLINQEPDFITFGDHPEEIAQDDPEEIAQDDPEEIAQDDPEEIAYNTVNSEVVQVDYSQDFLILENLGYIQISLLGALLLYFVLALVVKFFKSFF